MEALSIPSTIEYRGFTITFTKISGEGTDQPKLRCQIREDESFVREIEFIPDHQIAMTAFVEDFTNAAKLKINFLYDMLGSTLDKFEKMIVKQVKRNVIDTRIADGINIFHTQIDIIKSFFDKID